MKSMKRLIVLCGLTALLGLSAGCQHIPLYDPYSGLYVSFDFSPVNGSYGMVEITSVMRVLVYDASTHAFLHEEYLPREGGFINVGPGYYDLIAYSYGSDVVLTSGIPWRDEAYAYCGKVGSALTMSKSGEDGQEEVHLRYPIITEPDGCAVATASNVFVPDTVHEDTETVHVVMEVFNLIRDWTFIANNVEGAENIKTVGCYVTGQIPGRYMWDGRGADELCAIGFDVNYDAKTEAITGTFRTFGKHPQALASVFVNIVIKNADGYRYQWIYDVTEQFDDPHNSGRQLVIGSPIVIPAADSGGFSPSVGDWDAEVVYIPLN